MVSMYRFRADVGEHEASVEASGGPAYASRFHQRNIMLIRRELTGQFRSHSVKLFLIQSSFGLANMCRPAGGNFCEILSVDLVGAWASLEKAKCGNISAKGEERFL